MTGESCPEHHSGAVEVICCSSARDFVHQTSPWGPFLGEKYEQFLSRPWVFRGHRDSNWPLQPTALRAGIGMLSGETSRWHPIRTSTAQPEQFEQVVAELRTLGAFYVLADQQGLALPEDSQTTREHMIAPWRYAKALRRCRDPWPPSTLLSLLGLAQHYGLPTRLLDWSYNVSVATYFACVGAAAEWRELETLRERGELTERLEKRREEGRMEVWALSLYATTPGPDVDPGEAEFVTVTTPGAGNANLRAQEGLFTLDNPARFDWDSRDFAEAMDEKVARRSVTAPVLVRFQLKIRDAPTLLTLLARERVTAAKLFPGYDGVVKALRERQWRVRPGET